MSADRDPEDARAYADRGTARALGGELELARADLERAFALGHADAAAFSSAGTVCMQLGDHRAAFDHFARALALDPGYAFAYYNRAKAYHETGDDARAAADLERCLALGPDEAFAALLRTRLRLVRSGSRVARDERGGVPVALRIVTFPPGQEPVADPVATVARMDEIVGGLGLGRVARLVAVEPTADGMAIAEAWAGDAYFGAEPRSLAAIARDLGPVVDDLVTLAAAGKWHGGLRPGRFVAGSDGVRLVALPWAALVTTLPRALAARMDPDAAFRAPELSAVGPAAAGPAADVFGLAATLRARAAPPIPDAAESFLAAATSDAATARPTMRDLRAELRRWAGT